jgi:hypothetical protein
MSAWSDLKEELIELKDQILEKEEEEPDSNLKENVDWFFRVMGNFLFVFICFVFLGGAIALVLLKINSSTGNIVKDIPFYQKGWALFILLLLVVIILRVLLKLKQYTNMYKLLRIYAIVEVGFMLYGLYKHPLIKEYTKAYNNSSGITSQLALDKQAEKAKTAKLSSLLKFDTLMVRLDDGTLVKKAYVTDASIYAVVDSIEIRATRLEGRSKVEPVLIVMLKNIKDAVDY